MTTNKHTHHGFTIVELLIVIVVIGILAAITTVAYNGMKTRANNTARINAASQVYKLVQLYRQETGNFPTTSAVCATIDNVCSNYAGTTVTSDNTTVLNRLRTLGTPPQSIPRQAGNYFGIYFDVYAPRGIEGDPSRDMLMMYWLEGQGQDCKLPAVRDSGGNPFVIPPEPYTSTTTDRTNCWIGI